MIPMLIVYMTDNTSVELINSLITHSK